jgi:hypothetical protein
MNAAIGASGGTGDAGNMGAAIAALNVDDTAILALGPCLLPSPVAAHLGQTAMSFVGAADQGRRSSWPGRATRSSSTRAPCAAASSPAAASRPA